MVTRRRTRGAAASPGQGEPDGAGRGQGTPPGPGPGGTAPGRTVPPAAERSAHRLYVQAGWTTLDRLPLIAPDARAPAEERLIALCRRLDVEPVAVRVGAAGVRILLRIKPSHSVAAVVTALKCGVGDALVLSGRPVCWAHGFAVSSVGPAELRLRRRHVRERDGVVRVRPALPARSPGPHGALPGAGLSSFPAPGVGSCPSRPERRGPAEGGEAGWKATDSAAGTLR